jgi:hypothetical protein
MRAVIGFLAPLRQIRSIALPILALLASQLSAAGHDLALQRMDTPIGGIRSAATVSNGSTVLWLWTVDSLYAGKHVYGSVTDTSGALRIPATAVSTKLWKVICCAEMLTVATTNKRSAPMTTSDRRRGVELTLVSSGPAI